ncbi:uncharacterized protein LOC135122372, partial [Zophobas morio]
MEYANVVWFPYYNIHINNIEKVQRRFLKYLYFREERTYPPVGFPQIMLLERYSMTALENRNKLFLALTIYKVVNNRLDCHDILRRICFNGSPRLLISRKPELFALPTPRTNVLKFSPVYRLCYI